VVRTAVGGGLDAVHHLVDGDDLLVGAVAAPLGLDLVLQMDRGGLGPDHLADGARNGQPSELYQFFGDGCHAEIRNGTQVLLQRGVQLDYRESTSFVAEGFDSGAVVWEPQHSFGTLENKGLFIQGFYQEMRYFCDCILEGKPAEQGSRAFALEVMKVYEAGLRSEGDTVPVL